MPLPEHLCIASNCLNNALQMLMVLQELQFGGAAAFTEKCRKISECDTALKGGDLSGDLGWLDPDPSKNKKALTNRAPCG